MLGIAIALSIAIAQTQTQTKPEYVKNFTNQTQTLLEVQCQGGKWKITHARDQKIIQETKAHQLEGRPCQPSQKTY